MSRFHNSLCLKLVRRLIQMLNMSRSLTTGNRLRSVTELVVGVFPSEWRDELKPDCLSIIAKSTAMPKLNKITISYTDAITTSAVQMILASDRPIRWLNIVPLLTPTLMPWDFRKIVRLSISNFTADAFILIGDSHLEDLTYWFVISI